MNYKKILLAGLLILAVVSSISVASAGWFDFGSSNEDLNLTITDSDMNVNVELGDHTLDVFGGATMTENGWAGSFEIDGTPNNYSLNGKMSLDLSSLSEDELNSLKETNSISNMTIKTGTIEYSPLETMVDFKVDGNTLTLYFNNVTTLVEGFDAGVEEYDMSPTDVEFTLEGADSQIHIYGSK